MLIGLKGRLRDTLLILKESLKSFEGNKNLEAAAAIAFYGFFALIPLLLLVIYFVGNYIISSQATVEGVESLVSGLLPQFGKVVTKEIYALSRHKGIWGALSIITLFWAITPLARTLRSSFSAVFREYKKSSFLKAKLFDLLTVIIMVVLFVLLVMAEIFYPMVSGMLLRQMPRTLSSIINIAAPLSMAMLFITLFYFTFSPIKLRYNYLMAGSLTTAALWSAMGPVFSLFLTSNPKFGIAFGSLKAVFIILLWVYYSFSVMLFGAEVMANMRRKDAILLKGLFLNAPMSKRMRKTITARFAANYNEGEVIFKDGESGSQMFYVISGAVAIIKNEQVLKVMKEGEYFGEMSMLLNIPRTATASVAEPDTQLVAISQDNFDVILRENPKVVIALLKEMASRLKAAVEFI